jgi:hypothetical protein
MTIPEDVESQFAVTLDQINARHFVKSAAEFYNYLFYRLIVSKVLYSDSPNNEDRISSIFIAGD